MNKITTYMLFAAILMLVAALVANAGLHFLVALGSIYVAFKGH
jgi:hypothetical protein